MNEESGMSGLKSLLQEIVNNMEKQGRAIYELQNSAAVDFERARKARELAGPRLRETYDSLRSKIDALP
jgi:hypothetical protein